MRALSLLRQLSLAFPAGLAACGGGGGAGGPDTVGSGTTLGGIAAIGAALAGAAADDGSFNLNLSTGQTLPCVLKGTGGTPEVTLYSFASSTVQVTTSANDERSSEEFGA